MVGDSPISRCVPGRRCAAAPALSSATTATGPTELGSFSTRMTLQPTGVIHADGTVSVPATYQCSIGAVTSVEIYLALRQSGGSVQGGTSRFTSPVCDSNNHQMTVILQPAGGREHPLRAGAAGINILQYVAFCGTDSCPGTLVYGTHLGRVTLSTGR